MLGEKGVYWRNYSTICQLVLLATSCKSTNDFCWNTLFKKKWQLTFSQIFDSSKLKEFADDNFKFNENDRKFSIRIENTVGKGEIARYKQFLLFPYFFKKTYTADM